MSSDTVAEQFLKANVGAKTYKQFTVLVKNERLRKKQTKGLFRKKQIQRLLHTRGRAKQLRERQYLKDTLLKRFKSPLLAGLKLLEMDLKNEFQEDVVIPRLKKIWKQVSAMSSPSYNQSDTDQSIKTLYREGKRALSRKRKEAQRDLGEECEGD